MNTLSIAELDALAERRRIAFAAANAHPAGSPAWLIAMDDFARQAEDAGRLLGP